MIKNIIFDLNGVLIEFIIIDFIKEFFKYKKKFILLLDFANPKISYNAIKFALTEPVVENGVLKLIEKYPKLNRHKKFMLNAINCQNIKPGAMKLIRDLKNKNYHLYILSNIGEHSKNVLSQKYPEFFEYFDQIYCTQKQNSYLCKPNKNFFTGNLKNIIGAETIFIDDKDANLNTAKEIGLKIVKFKNIAQIRKELY